MALEKVDAVIVGAGAAGSVFAAVLTRAGKKVVLLEQGPDWKLTDLISSDIWGRRLKGAGPTILYEGKDAVGRTGDHGWGTGGAALHYSANFPRLLPDDFTVKSDHGRALDWPISYADVAPYYDKVAREIGVSGDAKAEERWRPPGEPYPMPPLKTFRYGEVWVPGFQALGLHVIRGAVGINSTPYKGRDACIYDGWCNAGCPTRALANPQSTWLGEAREKGAEVRPFSYVTRVLTNAAGTRVTGVEYYDDKKAASGAGGKRRRARGLCLAEPAPAAQLAHRQAPGRPGEPLRPRRQVPHGPWQRDDRRDLRRGRAELRGLGGLRLRDL